MVVEVSTRLSRSFVTCLGFCQFVIWLSVWLAEPNNFCQTTWKSRLRGTRMFCLGGHGVDTLSERKSLQPQELGLVASVRRAHARTPGTEGMRPHPLASRHPASSLPQPQSPYIVPPLPTYPHPLYSPSAACCSRAHDARGAGGCGRRVCHNVTLHVSHSRH